MLLHRKHSYCNKVDHRQHHAGEGQPTAMTFQPFMSRTAFVVRTLRQRSLCA